jgi:hypothetical protein
MIEAASLATMMSSGCVQTPVKKTNLKKPAWLRLRAASARHWYRHQHMRKIQ